MAEEERAALRDLYSIRMITIKVGDPKDQAVTAHEHRLREHSSFFRAALEKDWKEKRERVINMPEESLEVLTGYLDWLYHQKVMLYKEDGDIAWGVLTDLYIFGDKICDDKFCDEVLGTMIKGTDFVNKAGNVTYPGPYCMHKIYNGTSECSPIRGFLVTFCVKFGTESWFDSFYPADFLKDMVKAFVRKRGAPPDLGSIYSQRAKWMKQKS